MIEKRRVAVILIGGWILQCKSKEMPIDIPLGFGFNIRLTNYGFDYLCFCWIQVIYLKMGHDAIKLELIEWLAKLEDDATIDYLKIVKDSAGSQGDWWYDLSEEQKAGIERGLKDITTGSVTPHDVVKLKYGL